MHDRVQLYVARRVEDTAIGMCIFLFGHPCLFSTVFISGCLCLPGSMNPVPRTQPWAVITKRANPPDELVGGQLQGLLHLRLTCLDFMVSTYYVRNGCCMVSEGPASSNAWENAVLLDKQPPRLHRFPLASLEIKVWLY